MPCERLYPFSLLVAMNQYLQSKDLPSALKAYGLPFFFYKCDRPKVCASDFEWLNRMIDDYTSVNGLGEAAKIDVLNVKPTCASEVDSFERIKKACGFDFDISKFEVLFCSWASLHNDPDWAGNVFVNLVLHTGPSGYVVGAHGVNYAKEGAVPVVTTQAYRVEVGDLFVLDPTVPHSAHPAYPSDGSFLAVLQVSLPFGNESEKLQIFEKLKPQKGLYQDAFA